MRLDTFFISLVLAAMFIGGGLMLIEKNIDNYDIDVTESPFEEVHDELNQIAGNVTKMQDDLTGQDVSGDNAWDNVITGTVSAFGNVWQMFGVLPKLIRGIADALFIDEIFIDAFLVIIFLAIVFSMIYTFWRFMPR
jgi:hypothetical protein